jgi:hypothetical protein
MREAIRRESLISWRRLVTTALESRHYGPGEDGGSTHHASYAEPDTSKVHLAHDPKFGRLQAGHCALVAIRPGGNAKRVFSKCNARKSC